MEEGPEPHEMIERTVEHHHHGHEETHDDAGKSFVQLPAMGAAVLAVLAAVGSLLSGHAASQAILSQTKASDRWAYFQAKSTKGHMYEVAGELEAVVRSTPGGAAQPTPNASRFRQEADRYNREKKEIQREAEHLEQESREEFHKHHFYALGIAAFQVGIVLASVSILVRYRALFALSLVAGAIGIVFLFGGLFTTPKESLPTEEAALRDTPALVITERLRNG